MKRKIIVTLVILCILFLSSCSLPGLGKSVANDGIIIAGGNMTERQIVAEIVFQMIEHYIDDVEISLINNMGSSTLIHQSMVHNNTNVSACMYTGTSLVGELEMKPIREPQKALEMVIKGFDEKFDRVWFPSYGFNNTYAFMVKREFAEENGLKTVSDLQSMASKLKVGVDSAWMKREGDGYNAFKEIYGFDFPDIYPMEIGLVYQAVDQDQMDVVLGYTTDGRIESFDLVVLEDDLQLFPPYDASPVTSKKVLKQYPELENVLLRLEGSITNETMQKLNRRSDELLVEPNIVAKQFLEENNFFEDRKIIPLAERGKPYGVN